MARNNLTSKLRRGFYTGIAAAAMGLGSLLGCGDGPIEPPKDEMPKITKSHVDPTSGMAPLDVRVQYSCSDDKGISQYRLINGTQTITTTTPVDTTLTYMGNGSLELRCTDTAGQTASYGPVNIQVSRPPPETDKIAWMNIRESGGKAIKDIYSGDIILDNGTYKLVNEKNLTNNPDKRDAEPTWSPDGNEIAYTSISDAGLLSIWRMNADGRNQRNISSHLVERAYNSDWCSNGLIAVAYRDKGDSEAGIGIINPAGSGSFTPIYSEPKTSTVPGWPSWSPDCSEIAFEKYIGNWEIFVINADGSNLVNLTNNPAIDGNPDWSPDGNKILFKSYRSGNADIYRMNPDGTDVRQITNNPGIETDPSYSSDGSKIIFAHDDDFVDPQIYLMNSDGTGEWTQLTTQGANRYPAWRPRQ